MDVWNRMGLLPIMVKSLGCHLRGASKSALVALREEANDFGGYFVAGGLEKCLRILIQTVRNSRAFFVAQMESIASMSLLPRSTLDSICTSV